MKMGGVKPKLPQNLNNVYFCGRFWCFEIWFQYVSFVSGAYRAHLFNPLRMAHNRKRVV